MCRVTQTKVKKFYNYNFVLAKTQESVLIYAYLMAHKYATL